MTGMYPETTQRVFEYMRNHWFVSELVIAKALGITVPEALDAQVELLRCEPEVIERGGLIGYIGDTRGARP